MLSSRAERARLRAAMAARGIPAHTRRSVLGMLRDARYHGSVMDAIRYLKRIGVLAETPSDWGEEWDDWGPWGALVILD